jgi:hypothetical protein
MTKSKIDDIDGTDAEGEHVDGCVEDVELDEMEETLDVELPPARGGVEQPVPPQS